MVEQALLSRSTLIDDWIQSCCGQQRPFQGVEAKCRLAG